MQCVSATRVVAPNAPPTSVPMTAATATANVSLNELDAASDIDAIHDRIERRLCELGNLVTGQFPLTRREVMRRGDTVADYYCLHGPRSVKLTAIVDHRRGEILFYGSDGIRKESVTPT